MKFMKNHHFSTSALFWAFLFIGLAVVLLLEALHLTDAFLPAGLSLWRILLGAVLAWWLIWGVLKLQPFAIFFPLAGEVLLFDRWILLAIGSEREDSIAFFTARSRFKGRDYVEATVLLDDFRRKFGRSVFIEDSEAMLAMCRYYLAPDPTRDQTVTGEAIIAFSEFIERYPNSKRVEAFSELITELTERLKKKAYLNAYTYYKIQRYKSAVVALRNALKLYPDTPHREDILYLIAVSNYRLAHNSIEEKQGERYLDVLDSYYSFINEFPESKHRKELERYTKEAKDYLDKNNIDKQK